MTRLDALKEVAAKVEAGAKIYPSDLNNAWGLWSDEWKVCRKVMLAGDGSLDAAKALHEATVGLMPDKMHSDARKQLLDTLRALIAREEKA